MNIIRQQIITKVKGEIKFAFEKFECSVAEKSRPMLLDFGGDEKYWIMPNETIQKSDPQHLYFMPELDEKQALKQEEIEELRLRIDNVFKRRDSFQIRRSLLAASGAGNDQLIRENFLSANLNKEEKAIVFVHAAQKGNIDLLKFFLDNGVEVDSKDSQGRSALHIACLRNKPEMVELLLLRGARVNDGDENGDSPLHLAVRMRCLEICKILHQNNADANITNHFSESPFVMSQRLGFGEISDILRCHKTHVESPFHGVVAVLDGAPIISNSTSQQDNAIAPRTSPASSSALPLSHHNKRSHRENRS